MSTPLHEPKEPSFWTENGSIHPHLETVETVENTRHLVVGEELPTLHDHFKPQEDESRPQPQMRRCMEYASHRIHVYMVY